MVRRSRGAPAPFPFGSAFALPSPIAIRLCALVVLSVFLGIGTAALDPPASPPRLTLSLGDPSVEILTWPVTPENFYVETATDLVPPVLWIPTGLEARTEGSLRQLVLPRGAGLRLYHLRYDPDLPSLMLDYARKSAADLSLVSVAGHEFPDLPFLDSFAPRRLSPLALVPRVVAGGFVLTPGLWEIELRSFCLKMGTPGPGEGDGYLSGPFEGPRAEIIARVLRNYSLDPAGHQESTQILLWAIILRTRIDTLPAAIQNLASAYLTPADLHALATAADRKAALDAAHTQRFIRFFLGPGGLFSSLPDEIRKTLTWDTAANDALAKSGQLSFEEVQNAVFQSSPPALPSEPGRDIAYGRWSWVPSENDPPGGYLLRYLIASYDATRVQLCVPAGVAVETDDLGRVTWIGDGVGNEIRVGYDGSVAPLAVTGDESVRGYAFASIALVGPSDPDEPRQLLNARHSGVGWVLTGNPTGGGVPASANRFPGAVARYQWALAQQAELQRLDSELSRVHPGRLPGPATNHARLMQLAHFCEGLRLALVEAEPEDGPDFQYQPDRLGLAYRAWVAEFARFAEGGSETHPAPASGLGREPIPLTAGSLAASSGTPRVNVTPAPRRTRFRIYMDWLRYWWSGGIKAQPGTQNQQDIAPSSKPTQNQVDQNHQIVQEYQNAVKPVRLLLGFLPLPSFLAINKVSIDGGIVAGLNLWGNTTDKLFTAQAAPDAPDVNAIPVPASLPPRGGTRAGGIRADFRTTTIEHFWDPGPIEGDPEVSQRRLDVTRALADAIMRVGAHFEALRVACERQAGALAAGDTDWYRRQGACAIAQQRSAGRALWEAADAVVAWTAMMREENVDDPWVTRTQLLEIMEQLRSDGFGTTERQTLRRAGLNDAEIDDCRRWVIDWVPSDDGFPLFGRMDGMADLCRILGAHLLELPDPFWPEGPEAAGDLAPVR